MMNAKNVIIVFMQKMICYYYKHGSKAHGKMTTLRKREKLYVKSYIYIYFSFN